MQRMNPDRYRVPLMAALCLFGVLAFAAIAQAASVPISGGAKGGNYERWAHNLAGLMKGQGFAPTVMTSKGAVENLARVKDGSAAVGWVQGDTLMANGADGVEILGTLGTECAFLVGRTDGKVRDEDDLQDDNGQTIAAVGPRGSGSQTTWAYMGQLEEDYKRSAAQYVGGTRAMGKLMAGQVDAMLFVTAPGNLDHRLIAAVNGNEKLEFLDVDDGDLNDKLPSGQPVYTFESVVVEKGTFSDTEVETICTPVLAVAKVDADDAILDELANILVGNIAAVTR